MQLYYTSYIRLEILCCFPNPLGIMKVNCKSVAISEHDKGVTCYCQKNKLVTYCEETDKCFFFEEFINSNT